MAVRYRILAPSIGGGGGGEVSPGQNSTGFSSGFLVGVNSSGALFNAGTTSWPRWDSSNARLGIGTTAPTHPLHVFQSAGVAGLFIQSDSTANIAQLRLQTSGDTATLWNLGAKGNGHFQIDNGNVIALEINSSGHVGIGTTAPETLLHLAATVAGAFDARVRFTAAGQVGSSRFDVGLSSVGVFFIGRTGIADDVNVNSSGHVGIGTTAPTARLEVTGTTVDTTLANVAAATNASTQTVFRVSKGTTNFIRSVKEGSTLFTEVSANLRWTSNLVTTATPTTGNAGTTLFNPSQWIRISLVTTGGAVQGGWVPVFATNAGAP